jgi:hypothetical protein
MAEFLELPVLAVRSLVYTDRIPGPMQLGLGKTYRWNVLELLDWVEARCPRRGQWIAMRSAVRFRHLST